MSKQQLSRRARERAVREVEADMRRKAGVFASAVFNDGIQRAIAVHPTMRTQTFVERFERAWRAAIGE